ncbi:o-succinylbenzoate synthase [Gloeothece verrucosa]|uniref:o-succinylbenzoate synthase n=1 Tax=Gloeothece verrucosa (strain PCC 7822) TaxID=497965 RepID=E0UL73_GLOV7|nr:o-succinylbenzoate synthase [Gloeothece verrucosa]ADN17703.1 o-succinylbenzoic acid (OSB) synthetase [Gloeothece verrucosa PCC 7822]
MKYRFEFHPYQRQFKQPLVTSHGLWKVRKGIIVRLTDTKGRKGLGEIAPLEWFGSESFEQALEFCTQLPSEITRDDILAISPKLSACQFGFESALENITLPFDQISSPISKPTNFSALLPSGQAALESWKKFWNQGYRTFKWKIGIISLTDELKILSQLAQVLPADVKLRLDANGGLKFFEAVELLKICDRIGIEFLEQPLPPTELEAMLKLSTEFSTLLALDESVATLHQLKSCYEYGWQDIFVIKPAIAGSPSLLRCFCQTYQIDTVFSSVFETLIGQKFALKLSKELSKNKRADGFGVNHWFANNDIFSEFKI